MYDRRKGTNHSGRCSTPGGGGGLREAGHRHRDAGHARLRPASPTTSSYSPPRAVARCRRLLEDIDQALGQSGMKMHHREGTTERRLGAVWTTATLLCTCSPRRSGSSTTWSSCGRRRRSCSGFSDPVVHVPPVAQTPRSSPKNRAISCAADPGESEPCTRLRPMSTPIVAPYGAGRRLQRVRDAHRGAHHLHGACSLQHHRHHWA